MTMRVFLIGAMNGPQNNIPEFQEARSIIYSKEKECYAPPLMMKQIDRAKPKELLCELTKMMCACDTVVTLPNWHEDVFAVRMVEIARNIGYNVEHLSLWKGGGE